MHDLDKKGFDTKCVHAGIGEYEFGSVVPPIYQTSTFKFKSARHGANLFTGEEKGHIYTRMSNPTVEAMENAVAALEGGYRALGCASGMAAIDLIFSTFLQYGDHVVCSTSVYGPTRTLLETVFSKFGVSTTFVNSSDHLEVLHAIRPETRVVYIETPGNPTLAVSDLAEISKIAKAHSCYLVVDNTFMSPALQRPLMLGADAVLHSMTKFLNGHADVVAGIVVVNTEELYIKMKKVLNQTGGVIDPFNSFLVHRGLKTLAIRMQRHCESATKIARYLEAHPMVKSVSYPGLPSHPQHEIAKKQHLGHGGMIAFELQGGFQAGEIMMNTVKLCQLAVSLGGVESLIQHPASMTHFTMGETGRAAAGITEGLVRLSVGIEDADDLIADLEQSFEEIKYRMGEKEFRNSI